MIWSLDTRDAVSTGTVGGKGSALIRAINSGFRVPEGCVLGTAFFEPWIDLLRTDEAWKGRCSENVQESTEACRLLKERTRMLELDPARSLLLRETLRCVFGDALPLLAVRSSSPEEDTGDSSFAGAYESILAVTEATLMDAIRSVFSSCLDIRIASYKQQRAYDPADVKIAVVIQRLVSADHSGTAFSANPLENDLDEVLVNASFGLGESIVSGKVTPDTYVFNRVTDRIVDRRLGGKEGGVFAIKGGGTEERAISGTMDWSLSDTEVREVAGLCVRAEEIIGGPADIEWAYEKGVLYLLQARPITTLFSIPPSMMTRPGEPRKLYLDFTLVGQGAQQPLSVLGSEFYSMIQNGTTKSLIGLDLPGLEESFFGGVEGRTYLNITNTLKVPGGMFFAKKLSREDPIVVSIFDDLPPRAYRTPGKPENLKFFLFKVIKATSRYTRLKYEPYKDPQGYKARFNEGCRARILELNRIEEETEGFRDLASYFVDWFGDFLVSLSLVMTTASHSIAFESIKKTFKRRGPEFCAAVSKLERGLPDNNTVAMGLDLERLISNESIQRYDNYGEWIAAANVGAVSVECRRDFDAYMDRYGCRCPMEIDAATTRPVDDPAAFYATLHERAIRRQDASYGRNRFEEAWKEREEAYAFLRDSLPEGAKRKKFERDYQVWVTLGGFREIHKHYMVFAIYRLRRRALELGRKFTDEGRLDKPEDIFNLGFDQIERALKDPSLDLREAAGSNLAWRRNWAKVREFPALLDSRGRILKAPRKAQMENEYRGLGISSGTVEGKVKVLRYPDEKPLFPGEILVARATDPGWTPLFVTAAAVILEIGGPTQHGAVVAREYGKPCVAGIEGATEIFKDGDMVLVDGAAGSIRILKG